jgi:hypothetical protein
MQQVSVSVPAGVEGGMTMQITHGSGVYAVEVPPGLRPGGVFSVMLPAANPSSAAGTGAGVQEETTWADTALSGAATAASGLATAGKWLFAKSCETASEVSSGFKAKPITVEVTVPPGCFGGQPLMVAHPQTGVQNQVVVPAGCVPGSTFLVEVPPVQTTRRAKVGRWLAVKSGYR